MMKGRFMQVIGMANNREKIVKLTDLPNYKDLFTGSLEKFGVTSIDNLLQVLKDDQRTALMISAVNGLGPKTIQAWKISLLENDRSSEETAKETKVACSSAESNEAPKEDIAGPVFENIVESVSHEDEKSMNKVMIERNLFCTMEELKEVQRTTTDLLQMNGAKKKGQLASIEYVSRRLTEAGLEVTVDGESGFPTVVATIGEGGLVLWGHLDTERMKGMKRKEQGEFLGDMIHGRGAADMKGAVACMLCAANGLATWNIPFSIVLTTDGLGEPTGAESLAKNPVIHNSIGILVLGPTGIRPIIGQIGYAAVKVRTVGEGSVMKMAAFLKMLTNQIAESSGQLSVKTGLIKGGKKKRPFESPRSCEVILELETLEATVSAIEKMESLLSGMEYEIEVLCQSEMIEFDRSSDLAKILADFTKKEPAFELIHSEAAKIVPVNQKIMICGPGNIVDAVTAQEYVTLSDLERTYEAILNLMDRLSPLEIEVPRLTDQ